MRKGRTKQWGAQTAAQRQAAERAKSFEDPLDLGGYADAEYLGRGYLPRAREILAASPECLVRLREHYEITAMASARDVIQWLAETDWNALTPFEAADRTSRMTSALDNMRVRVVLARVASFRCASIGASTTPCFLPSPIAAE